MGAGKGELGRGCPLFLVSRVSKHRLLAEVRWSAEFRLRCGSMACGTWSLSSGVFHSRPGFEEPIVEISTCHLRSRCCGFGNPRSFCRRVSRPLRLAAAPGSAEFRLRSRSMTCDTRSLPSGVFHLRPGFEGLVVEISTCCLRPRCCGFGNPRSFSASLPPFLGSKDGGSKEGSAEGFGHLWPSVLLPEFGVRR